MLLSMKRSHHSKAIKFDNNFEVRVLPNQYLPYLRRSKFNLVLSSHWLFTPSHSYKCLVRVTRTCMIHVRFYIRFCDTRINRMVSSESLVRVTRTSDSYEYHRLKGYITRTPRSSVGKSIGCHQEFRNKS